MKPVKKNILITGGAGFIGSHIAEFFHENANVRIFDDLSSGDIKKISKLNVDFIRGSILDKDKLSKAISGIDYVFHMAALISVSESMLRIEDCEKINVLGVINTLEACKNAGVKKIVLASSAAVYGNSRMSPKSEDLIPEPRSPYAISKLSGEYYCRLFNDSMSLPTASLRFFNVFGPRQNPNSTYAAVIPKFINQALANNPITIHGNGNQTRDFISVDDVVEALVFICMNTSLNGIYNIGYGHSTSIHSIASKIIGLCNSKSIIKYDEARPGDVQESLADISRISSVGFKPVTNLEEGLEKTIKYFREEYYEN